MSQSITCRGIPQAALHRIQRVPVWMLAIGLLTIALLIVLAIMVADPAGAANTAAGAAHHGAIPASLIHPLDPSPSPTGEMPCGGSPGPCH